MKQSALRESELFASVKSKEKELAQLKFSYESSLQKLNKTLESQVTMNDWLEDKIKHFQVTNENYYQKIKAQRDEIHLLKKHQEKLVCDKSEQTDERELPGVVVNQQIEVYQEQQLQTTSRATVYLESVEPKQKVQKSQQEQDQLEQEQEVNEVPIWLRYLNPFF